MQRRRSRAFSYVEVLFAIFLALTAALIYSATMPIANKSRAKANHTNVAVSLAQKQMEAIKSRGYASITADALAEDESHVGRPNLIDSNVPHGDGGYTFNSVDLAIVDSPSSVLPNGDGRIWIDQVDLDLREVRIQISWNENGTDREVTIGTMVANL